MHYVTLPNRINTLPPRRTIPDKKGPKLVLQGEFGLTSRTENPLIKTTGFNSCIVVPFLSNNMGGLAHFDIGTDVTNSFRNVIIPELKRNSCSNVQAALLGGLTSISEGLVRQIRDELQASGIRIIGMDLFNPDAYPGLMLNIENRELINVIANNILEMDDETRSRFLQAFSRQTRPAPRLIQLV